MCTVSFVNTKGKVVITSNRDEQTARAGAIAPKSYFINHKNILFPKDSKAGGTWYAVDEYSNVVVLLNGAEEKHIPKDTYRKSRGLIVLDLIGSTSPLAEWQAIDLSGIEPFTLVLFEQRKLYELRWDESAKHMQLLDTAQPYIWSSSTLYSSEIRAQRAAWFRTFLETAPTIDEDALFDFHRYTEQDNSEHGLVINRMEALKTLSITQAVIEDNKVRIHYNDLVAATDFSNSFISV